MFFSVSSRSLPFVVLSAALLVSACGRKDPSSTQPPPPENTIKTVALHTGDTLIGSMGSIGLASSEVNDIVAGLRTVFKPRYCRAGDNYEVELDTSSKWVSFRYYPAGLDYYVVEKSTDGTVGVSRQTKPVVTETVSTTGTLSTSLWEAMRTNGIEPEVIVNFADIFAWQVDFLTDPRKGDRFKVTYTKETTEDGKLISSTILAAQYVASGQEHTAVRFTDSAGETDYYTPEGRSMRSAFLKAPLQYRRISSHFTRKRFHPILKYYRPHLGIDYAAPQGTPVSAVGDGVVIFAGRSGGFGNLLKIRHPNGYVTYYGHLHRFARGVRRGVRVRQGQLIAYVGSTGLSTGPHLDFRIKRNGSFINYLSLKFPAAKTVSRKDRERFEQAKAETFGRLAAIQ